MKKVFKITMAAMAITAVVFLKFLTTFLINENGVLEYNVGNYKKSEDLTNALFIMNFPEEYVVEYNMGNIYYQQGKYAEAKTKYKNALMSVPREKGCAVRHNLAMAMLKDMENNNIDMTVKEIKAMLTEGGCENFLDENEETQDDDGDDGDENDEEHDDENNEEKEKMEEIERQIREIEKEASHDRNNAYIYHNGGYNYGSKNW